MLYVGKLIVDDIIALHHLATAGHDLSVADDMSGLGSARSVR
jgi:hypothetical protein